MGRSTAASLWREPDAVDTRRYVKHFMLLMSGTALGQLLNLAAYPFLTRTYTPHDFGIFSAFVAVSSTLGAVACARFDVVIQVASHAEKHTAHALAQLISLGVSLLASTGLFIWWLAFGGQFTPAFAALTGIAVFLLGYTSASSLLSMKGERYKVNSAALIIRTLLTAAPQVLLFSVWPSALGLSVGFCTGLGAQALLFKLAMRSDWRPRVSWRRLSYILQRYRRYALDVPNQLLSALSLHALSFILLALFGATEAGFYSIAYRLAALPLGIFSSSLSNVYFQKAAQSYRAGGVFWKELRFNLLASSALAASIFGALMLCARPLAVLYLGADWALSGEIMVYLAPLLALRFVSVSISATPLVTGKLHWLFFNNVALLVAIATPALLAKAYDMQLADYIVLTAALGSVAHVVYIGFLLSHTRRHYAHASA